MKTPRPTATLRNIVKNEAKGPSNVSVYDRAMKGVSGKFQALSSSKATATLLKTFVFCALAIHALSIAPAWALPVCWVFSTVAFMFLFEIGYDCSKDRFFASHTLNSVIGTLSLLPLIQPVDFWANEELPSSPKPKRSRRRRRAGSEAGTPTAEAIRDLQAAGDQSSVRGDASDVSNQTTLTGSEMPSWASQAWAWGGLKRVHAGNLLVACCAVIGLPLLLNQVGWWAVVKYWLVPFVLFHLCMGPIVAAGRSLDVTVLLGNVTPNNAVKGAKSVWEGDDEPVQSSCLNSNNGLCTPSLGGVLRAVALRSHLRFQLKIPSYEMPAAMDVVARVLNRVSLEQSFLSTSADSTPFADQIDKMKPHKNRSASPCGPTTTNTTANATAPLATKQSSTTPTITTAAASAKHKNGYTGTKQGTSSSGSQLNTEEKTEKKKQEIKKGGPDNNTEAVSPRAKAWWRRGVSLSRSIGFVQLSGALRLVLIVWALTYLSQPAEVPTSAVAAGTPSNAPVCAKGNGAAVTAEITAECANTRRDMFMDQSMGVPARYEVLVWKLQDASAVVGAYVAPRLNMALTASGSAWLIGLCAVALVAALVWTVVGYFRSGTPVYLVDFVTFSPPEGLDLEVPKERFMEIQREFDFSEASLEFMDRLIQRTGLGDKTYLPPGCFTSPPDLSLDSARKEAELVIFGCLDKLFSTTHITPSMVDVLVLNCSLFNPTPSLTAMVINKYKMREDVQSYNLAGMGCSAGVISVHLARDLLQVYKKSYAVVISTENITQNWYIGNERGMLISNTLFRMGGAAVLLSNNSRDKTRSKYKLKHTVRTHMGASDEAYHAVYQDTDTDGNLGVRLSKGLMGVAARALRKNITSLGPLVLPWSELGKYAFYMLLRRLGHKKKFVPNFKKGVQHFCVHAGGRAVVDAIEEALNLDAEDVAASKATLARYGNTSSSSIWYELGFLEKWGRVRKGNKVWQIAFGSGFKCNSAVWEAL